MSISKQSSLASITFDIPPPPKVEPASNAFVFPSSKEHSFLVKDGSFESENHFYPRVLNATIHPLVSSFFSLGNERILQRYCHLNPAVDESRLRQYLAYKSNYFFWAGSDLMNVTTPEGKRQMIVIETNSCPSGQKSMPLLSESEEYGGYGVVLMNAFKVNFYFSFSFALKKQIQRKVNWL